ncbi:hypothetical protein FJZ48_02645 [Candidatus Uhrbacteria bacterium]|nr:hypothetical protein [Candidatus Uhrbacteria bacterium]
MTRAIDGRHFDQPLQSILEVIARRSADGVGVVGNYDHVVTLLTCTSRYRAIPGSGACPTKGEAGNVHQEQEVIVTVVAPKKALGNLLQELKENHPYETPVFDVVELIRHEFDAYQDS